MSTRWCTAALGAGAWLLLAVASATADDGGAALYATHCASCHGADRLGAIGPALLPENLGRLPRKRASAVVAAGLPATQMPAFSEILTPSQIAAVVGHVYSPLAEVPPWGQAEIESTRVLTPVPDSPPRYQADPLNLFLVVESGDHHVTVLDGDRLEPIHRFKSRYALHGGPKFSPDGRYTYLASRDGWITKFDIQTLSTVAEVRAGINTRNIAVSSDGRHVMVANYLPHTLVVLRAEDLGVEKVIAVADGAGRTSRVSAVYDAPPRNSFIAALKDIEEVWEIQYADEPVYYGRVHDYRVEGPPKIAERFPVRRIELDDYLDDFFFDPAYENLIGAARNAKNGQVVNLLVGRKIADIDLAGLPHLGSGITWEHDGRQVLATPNLKESEVTVIEMKGWKVVKRIPTLGPGFFMRSHENTPYAWVDVFFGKDRDAMHVIDKKTLEIVATLRPAPGKTAAHVEFTRDGRYALVSIWDMDGALVVYDAATLTEVKRLPMVKPSGKYNVHNKITRSAGTSH
ncbi:MAG: c-type cytochrome [Ectothiorhodospiraceae bacterium]|nr:c-type cytochrome [Chromatiales bacterium]MCP5154112.1 c-type cytochrome [Ectothiorhodospiraceae bacterium]